MTLAKQSNSWNERDMSVCLLVEIVGGYEGASALYRACRVLRVLLASSRGTEGIGIRQVGAIAQTSVAQLRSRY